MRKPIEEALEAELAELRSRPVGRRGEHGRAGVMRVTCPGAGYLRTTQLLLDSTRAMSLVLRAWDLVSCSMRDFSTSAATRWLLTYPKPLSA